MSPYLGQNLKKKTIEPFVALCYVTSYTQRQWLILIIFTAAVHRNKVDEGKLKHNVKHLGWKLNILRGSRLPVKSKKLLIYRSKSGLFRRSGK